ncbi:OLC1v1003445C5 [Oldenlandia corymbosa var. corymbosa]|nr:OLC1v1003445C5 [Oldenlandia corymbosa var. corymbosa]
MDWSSPQRMLFFAAFLIIISAAIHGVSGDTMVSGTVFCDQCKDGQVSLFDYPLHGIKVTIACPGGDGKLTTWREETTSWAGGYAMRFGGTPDLRACYAQVSGNAGSSGSCGASAGPAQSLKLMFDMFGMAMYTVDPLISQPAAPMSFCPRTSSPVPVPTPVTPVKSPPTTPTPSPPAVPKLPPIPFVDASVCPYQKWIMPEYRCQWKVVTPDTKVAVAFGLIAAQRYGTDLTLWHGMQGRGEPYRTLLREGTAALLNSYNTIQFPYHPLAVVASMNYALTAGSTQQVLRTALRFMRANSGDGHVSCKLSPCYS